MPGSDTYLSLEQLESLLSENGYICYGHGTGRKGNSEEVVDSIFNEGLRTKDNSLYFTTVGLSTPTPELKKQFKESNFPEPTIESLKTQLNNWPHFNSKKIIIARLPIKYINTNGDSSDIDGERFGAFFTEKVQPNGKITYYLDTKFIFGCYDVEKQLIRLNKNYERVLSESTIERLKNRYKKAFEKTRARLSKTALPFKSNREFNIEKVENLNNDNYDSFEISDFEWNEDDFVGKVSNR